MSVFVVYSKNWFYTFFDKPVHDEWFTFVKREFMKKMYVIIASLLTVSVLNAQSGEIQNGGFEDWTTNTLFDYPNQWGNSNLQESLAQAAVVKSTDAQEGSYSAELRANDDLGAYVFHGQINLGTYVGIPYTDSFDTVKFQYKCDFATGDSLYLIIVRFTADVPTDTLIIPVAHGMQNSWTQAVVPIPAGTQDELFFALSMGDPINDISVTPGAWARIDNVELYNGASIQTDLPNNNFETWTTQTLESADYWYSYSEQIVRFGVDVAHKTTDAHSGMFAMEMVPFEHPVTQDIYPSGISMTPFNAGLDKVPYTASPTTFSGWYKFSSPASNDEVVIVEIKFFENGSQIGGTVQPLDTGAVYDFFSFPLIISGVPDSIKFNIYGGFGAGCVLKLDDLSFSGGNVGVSEFEHMNVAVYPNPASSEVMIKAEGEYSVEVVDLTGKVVMHKEKATGVQILNVEVVIPGTYLVRLNNGNTMTTHKLVVE